MESNEEIHFKNAEETRLLLESRAKECTKAGYHLNEHVLRVDDFEVEVVCEHCLKSYTRRYQSGDEKYDYNLNKTDSHALGDLSDDTFFS